MLMIENRPPFFSEKIFFREIKKFIELCNLAFQNAQKQVPTPKIRKVRYKKPRGEQWTLGHSLLDPIPPTTLGFDTILGKSPLKLSPGPLGMALTWESVDQSV